MRPFAKLVFYTFTSQCLKVLASPSTWRNDVSPSDNGMSHYSLLLFHHLIASFSLFPAATIVIPSVRTKGGLADILSSVDPDWPVVFTVRIPVTPLIFFALIEWADCHSFNSKYPTTVWAHVLLTNHKSDKVWFAILSQVLAFLLL